MRRIVEITERGTVLSVDGARLAVKSKTFGLVALPFAELECVMLAESAVTVTGGVLERLADAGIPLVACRKHVPVGWYVSLPSHERVSVRQDWQLGASRPLRKKLWAALVVAKIENQAAALEVTQPNSPDIVRLERLAATVRSGDIDNKEGVAAQCPARNELSDFNRL